MASASFSLGSFTQGEASFRVMKRGPHGEKLRPLANSQRGREVSC